MGEFPLLMVYFLYSSEIENGALTPDEAKATFSKES
jgi:hypothetical protein